MRDSNKVTIKEVVIPIVGTAPLVMHKWRCGGCHGVNFKKNERKDNGSTTNN
ncbi:MAG: hypothetical protein GQ468_02765 [Candidatus Scalindua sp.]|nr:hypothetical protein [Candidatus Scalindua sp.]